MLEATLVDGSAALQLYFDEVKKPDYVNKPTAWQAKQAIRSACSYFPHGSIIVQALSRPPVHVNEAHRTSDRLLVCAMIEQTARLPAMIDSNQANAMHRHYQAG